MNIPIHKHDIYLHIFKSGVTKHFLIETLYAFSAKLQNQRYYVPTYTKEKTNFYKNFADKFTIKKKLPLWGCRVGKLDGSSNSSCPSLIRGCSWRHQIHELPGSPVPRLLRPSGTGEGPQAKEQRDPSTWGAGQCTPAQAPCRGGMKTLTGSTIPGTVLFLSVLQEATVVLPTIQIKNHAQGGWVTYS